MFSLLLLLTLAACNITGGDDDSESGESAAQPSTQASDASVTINAPVEGSEVAVGSEILVYSVARDAVGVTRVDLLEDGRVLDSIASPNPAGQTELSVLQTWNPAALGQRTLSVIAYRGEEVSAADSVSVRVVESAAQIQTPAATPVVIAPQPTADTSCRLRVNLDGLPLRATASTASEPIGALAIGEVLPIQGRVANNTWYELTRAGGRGWVEAGYVAVLGNCSALAITGEVAVLPTPTSLPTIAPPATQIPSPTADPRICRARITPPTQTAHINPGTNTGTVATLQGGSEWPIYQRTVDGAWWQLSINGVLGWVPAGSISTGGECASVLVTTPSPVPNQPPVIAPILSRSLTPGEVLLVTLGLNDPEGDSLTFAAQSGDETVVRAAPGGASSLQLTAVNPGVTTVTVTVSDGRGGTVSETFAVSVAQPQAENQAPLLPAVSDTEVEVGEEVVVDVNAVDPDGETPQLSVDTADPEIVRAGADTNGNVAVFGLAPGTTEITVTAQDSEGESVTTTFEVTVSEAPNEPPTIQPVSDQTVNIGETVTVALAIDDPESEAVTIQVQSSNPAVAAAAPDDDGNLTLTGIGSGTSTISLLITDEAGATATTGFLVVVPEPASPTPNTPPIIAPIAAQTLQAGQTITVEITVTDPDGTPVTLSAESSDSGIATAAPSAETGQITVSGVSAGQATITVIATDASGGSNTASFAVTVAPSAQPNQPPIVEGLPAQEVAVGASLEIPVSATDPEGEAILLRDVRVGSTDIATATVDAGVITVNGLAPGQTTVSLTVADPTGGAVTTSFVLTVAQAPNLPPAVEPIPAQAVNIGETIEVPVIATDPEGFNPFIEDIQTDDAVARVTVAEGALRVTGISPGTLTITFAVNDTNGGITETGFTLTVVAPATETPIPNNPPTVQPISDQSLRVGESVTLPVIAEDPEGFNLFIQNVTSAAATIATAETDGEGNIVVEAIAPGTVAITLEVSDDFNAVPLSFQVTVTDPTPIPNEPPVLEAVQEQSVIVGESREISVAASDPEGFQVFFEEVESAAETIATVEVVDGAFIVTGVAEGRTSITFTVNDGQGNTTPGSFDVIVSPAPTPTPSAAPIVEPIPPQQVDVGQTVTVPVNAEDPEGFNTFIEVVYTDEAVAVVEAQRGELRITGITPGTLTVQITVNDGQGGVTPVEFALTVGEAATATPIPNQPPVVQPIPDQTLIVGQTLSLPVDAEDPEGFNTFIENVTSAAETIVTAETDGEGNLVLTAQAPGTVTISAEVSDTFNTTPITFQVTVLEPTVIPNAPPSVEPIAPQSVFVGETLEVPVIASDPEGFQPFIENLISAAETIATVSVDDGNLMVTGIAPGETVIRFTVNDGQGNTTDASFNVTVSIAPTATPTPNDAPIVESIPPQTVEVGETISVPVNATDPEGFNPFIENVESDTVLATVRAREGNVEVTGNAPGTLTISFIVSDGQGGETPVSFELTVIQPPTPTPIPNEAPEIAPIPDQVVTVGDTINVIVNAGDPEGFQPVLTAVSAAATIATVDPDGEGNLNITGVAPGTTQITVTADDTNGQTASVTFNVTVPQPPDATPIPNAPPALDPIPEQTVNVGEFVTVPFVVTDPEGVAVQITAVSSDESIASAQAGADSLTIAGRTPGSVTITVTADDTQGNIVNTAFLVTVLEGAPDVTPTPEPEITETPAETLPTPADLPPLPEISGEVETTIQAASAGDPLTFALLGDAPDVLAGETIDASALPELEALLTAFTEGARIASAEWTAADLLNPANNPEACVSEANPVACAVVAGNARYLVIVTGRNDALNGTPPVEFADTLRAIVAAATSRGAVPVLTTLPGDAALVGDYNAAILTVAAENNLPVWNLAGAIPAEQVNPDLTLTASGEGALLTPETVAGFGAARRDEQFLRLLDILTGE